MYSFPELVALRKYNKKGEEYSFKHIENAIKNKKAVLFGSYPFDIDKKTVMMNMVNEKYDNGEIEWVYDKNGKLKKENFDACDSLICALAYVNINHHGVDDIKLDDAEITKRDNEIVVNYKIKVWDREYNKVLNINNK